MSNFAVDDIHRSLRRQIAIVLTEPWKVRTERQPVTPDDRPVCVVESSSPVTTGKSRVSIPQGPVEKMMAFSAMAYPELGATARESRLEASRVQQLLDDTFTHGLVEQQGSSEVNIGAPFRVPVYDYENVPVVGRNRQGPADPYGFAWIANLAVRSIQDTADPLRFTVACELRLSWEAGGRLPASAPIVTEVPVLRRIIL
jgi:hypothetical protein